jgi:hypothetical protein
MSYQLVWSPGQVAIIVARDGRLVEGGFLVV